MNEPVGVEDLLRELAPQVLGALGRGGATFASAEDAVQEALVAAARQWPAQGVPDQPRAWLVTVARRRLADQARQDAARRRREARVAAEPGPAGPAGGGVEPDPAAEVAAGDDTLLVLFLCCHPALRPPAQIALTLRAVGGLSTAEIARAFLVPEATMGQRISRAKQQITRAGATFVLPPPDEQAERLAAVEQVLYLIFNEGYTATGGPSLGRTELAGEAIRLARLLHALAPDDGEVAGLLALMLLTEARRPARTRPDGSLVPLADQDRSQWDRHLIAEGVALVSTALQHTRLGPYQLQAAIAAVHDEATADADTDWVEILGLYRLLERLSPERNPMVTLNRAVAQAMVDGPQAGLALLDELETDPRLARHHRLHAVRSHLRERAGDRTGAAQSARVAARYATNAAEKHYLEGRAASLGASSDRSSDASTER